MFDHNQHRDTARDGAFRPEAEAFADREVPLGPTGRVPSVVQAWLDGEMPEAAVRLGDTGRDVDFWNRVNGDLATMRSVSLPTGFEARLMAALPTAAPVATPWYRRAFNLHPIAAIGAGATLIALGAAVGASLAGG